MSPLELPSDASRLERAIGWIRRAEPKPIALAALGVSLLALWFSLGRPAGGPLRDAALELLRESQAPMTTGTSAP